MIDQVKTTIAQAIDDLEAELLKVNSYFQEQDIETVKAQDTRGQIDLDPLFGGYTPQIWTPKPKRGWILFPPIPEIDQVETFIKEIRPRRRTQRLWNQDGAFYWNHVDNLVNMFISVNKDLIDQEFEIHSTLDTLSHTICSDQINLNKPPPGFLQVNTDDHLTRAFRLGLNHKIRELIKEKVNTIEDLKKDLRPLASIGFDTDFGWIESPEAIKNLEDNHVEAMKRAFESTRYQRRQAVTDRDGFNWETGEVES